MRLAKTTNKAELIRQMKAANPELSVEVIAERTGTTHQQVRKALERRGGSTVMLHKAVRHA